MGVSAPSPFLLGAAERHTAWVGASLAGKGRCFLPLPVLRGRGRAFWAQPKKRARVGGGEGGFRPRDHDHPPPRGARGSSKPMLPFFVVVGIADQAGRFLRSRLIRVRSGWGRSVRGSACGGLGWSGSLQLACFRSPLGSGVPLGEQRGHRRLSRAIMGGCVRVAVVVLLGRRLASNATESALRGNAWAVWSRCGGRTPRTPLIQPVGAGYSAQLGLADSVVLRSWRLSSGWRRSGWGRGRCEVSSVLGWLVCWGL